MTFTLHKNLKFFTLPILVIHSFHIFIGCYNFYVQASLIQYWWQNLFNTWKHYIYNSKFVSIASKFISFTSQHISIVLWRPDRCKL